MIEALDAEAAGATKSETMRLIEEGLKRRPKQ
jgi:hypothetical protein